MCISTQGAARHIRVQHRVPDRMYRVALVLTLLLPSTAFAQESTSTVPVVVTSGEATLQRTPEVAFVTVSVESRASNPRDAQRQNSEAMTAVQSKLAAARMPK